MDSTSYLYIYNLLLESKNNDVLEVHKSELRSCFKMLRHLMRERGWLGYENTGELRVNRRGLVDIVKSLFREDFGWLGELISIDVHFDHSQNIRVVGIFEGNWTYQQYYNFPNIQDRAKIVIVEE